MKTFLLFSMALILNACHPFAMFRPRAIKVNKASLHSKIHIAIDKYGIPFVKGDSMDDVAYGLGYMHARDRLFQLDLIRHAALGRVAELFGARGLPYDRRLRLLTYRLDEQVEKLSLKEHRFLDSYVRGVNDGAIQRGRTVEHFLLGVDFEKFSKRDVIAIARLQSWQLGSDLFSEITRLKIARSAWPLDVKSEFLSAVDDRGTAIIKGHLRGARKNSIIMPSYLKNDQNRSKPEKIEHHPKELIQSQGGASNAWVVGKSLSRDGYAMLMNDPHLTHNLPSNFYLVTLSAKDFLVTGATFVGLPCVLIGASRSLAWGVTASYLNTEDLVLLDLDKDKNAYIVDGKKIALVKWPQQFCLNKKGSCSYEMNYLSMFGPVINKHIDKWIENDDMFAVQWTGFQLERHDDISGDFINLAKAKNVTQGVKIIKSMTLPGVNIVLADTNGDIAYAYAGLVPKRDPTQNPYLPLDGRFSSSLWQGFLLEGGPSIIDPSTGYIVTANQNIFGEQSGVNFAFGDQGAPPFRALRIEERIKNMLKEHPTLDFNELSSIQLDSTSVEAKELAPLLGAICVERFKNSDGKRKDFAEKIANFQGHYTIDSLAALPYELLIKEIVSHALKGVLADVEERHYISNARFVVKDTLLKELRGQHTALFASFKEKHENVATFIGDACEAAFQDIVKKAGTSPWTWRWGRHHFLQLGGPLAKLPLIGAFFRDRKREVAGVLSAPMAEGELPVTQGANLRFRVKMTSPPEVYAVIDSGNSGTVGDKNYLDQAKLWREGKSIAMETDWNEALKKSVMNFGL